MSLITARIKRLRELSTSYETAGDAITRELLIEAADTIEMLSDKAKPTCWIPCSERLPEEGIEVLVWYRYWRYGEYNNWYYTYGIGYQFDNYWSVIDGGTKTTVYAWQELPEPYEPQESEGHAIEIQDILTKLHREYQDTENGAAGEDVRWWNAGIRRAIEIVENS